MTEALGGIMPRTLGVVPIENTVQDSTQLTPVTLEAQAPGSPPDCPLAAP
jgi:hypothetical protein